MGALYDFHCPVCDRKPEAQDLIDEEVRFPYSDMPSGTPLGCGLHYPYVCKSIYEDIRKGKLGSEARKKLFWMVKPGIYHQRVVFVCEKCGKWHINDDIKICRRKHGAKEYRGSSLDRERDAQAGPWLEPLCYLDRKRYDVIWETTYPCSHCGGRTQALDKPENLRCNRCGTSLEVSMTGCWD